MSDPVARQETEKTIYSLSQLGRSLKRTLEQVTAGKVMWFRAEIAELSRSGAGHLYLSLVEELAGKPVAKMKATIWQGQLRSIRQELGELADQVLSEGSEIVFSGQVTFHAVYGLNLVIDAVDLQSMLGEAERRKQATIATLKSVSCPMPVNTGTGESAMARHMSRSLKASKSSADPPPRTNAMTWGSIPAASFSASMTVAGDSLPCTTAGNT